MIFRSRRKQGAAIGVAELESETADFSDEELSDEIAGLTAANRERRDADIEARLVALRHLLGMRRMDTASGQPRYPDPAFEGLPGRNGDLAGVGPGELTPELVRAGILRDGCLLVRGLIDRERALGLADEISRAFDAQREIAAGRLGTPGYYLPFRPDERFPEPDGREWVAEGGGIWAADSPHLMFEMLEAFEGAGLVEVIRGYLGESPTVSLQKCTLRRVDPDAKQGWHQDGAFMGDVRALNVWLSLSRCGDEAPGLDIVPRRLDHIVPTGTEGAWFDWSVSPQVVEETAEDTGVLRPIFEPGDVLLFDDLFLHATAAEPEMKKSRLAIESWFFGASASPTEYAPLAV